MEEEIKILFVDFVGFEKTVKVMSYAKGIASMVKNPITDAISNLDDRIETANAKKLKEFRDFGILGKIDNDEVLLGNEKVMLELGQSKLKKAITFYYHLVNLLAPILENLLCLIVKLHHFSVDCLDSADLAVQMGRVDFQKYLHC